ncbi:CHAT domain-containing protein [Actinoplanes siamensis]|uniref:CHAT domain-containing protein n=1 Tax=Actinoplanes siamensis TaxID=1223317 RepID=A0A919N9R8_9ACTN|nr:CHAT domain-containing protein [Actinoplanes siamensis]GIF06845.1 hypothetical protein Asi03nite_43830 [Actinoplanes siamensis]
MDVRGDENITRLRDRLARRRGAARVPILVTLGQELTGRYWRAGPGQPAALGDLSTAIEVWDEAYRLLDAGDPARAQVAGQLGWLLSIRHSAHGGGPRDRDTGILVLGEALTGAGLPPAQVAVTRLSLGQLHLGRATESLNPAAARAGFLTGSAEDAADDAEVAVRLFREIVDGPALSADVTAMARTSLALAESIQPLLAGDLARFDLGKIMETLSALQRIQRTGMPSTPFIPGSPLDYPVTVLAEEENQAPTVPPRRPAPAPTAPGSAAAAGDQARQAARDRLAALAGDPTRPVWQQARTLLLSDPHTVPTGDLDAFVGAAAGAVDEPGASEASGTDFLLSAIGLGLRGRLEGSGWGDDSVDGTLLTAARHLSAAAARIPAGHPAAPVVVEAAGALLDRDRPFAGAITGIAAGIHDYARRIPDRPPVVNALSQLCRTVTALLAGDAADPDTLAAAVPGDHPWRPVLDTAVAQLRLAEDLRAGRIGDDAAFPDPDSPRALAVRGATRLIRAGDPDGAIPLLAEAARTLADGALRTRTRWRLAEAHRARGDAGPSRDAGLAALRGPGTSRREAARFAGWMLAEGRAEEAFIALEIAATAPGDPDDPPGRDLVQAVLGIAPPAEPAPLPPAPAQVAAAVRDLGANALLYLHPTDDAGRTAGVLCLDPATDRLDVLANVPASDPLVSDDPGWAAVLGRWSAGSLLVAASDGLARLPLAAVRTPDGRHRAEDLVLAHVASGSQVIRLAGRTAPAVGAAPVFVVNPRGDRDPEMAETLVVRRLFYPRSACLGRALEPADGPGTPEDLLERLPAASVLHLACGLRGTELQLAGGTLDLTTVRGASGLAILSEGSAPALLDAGCTGVIGWRWPVPPEFAALALFLVHLELVDHRRPPAAAVGAVHRWMLDPGRVAPPFLTGAHLNTVATMDLTRPDLWAALSYHGR